MATTYLAILSEVSFVFEEWKKKLGMLVPRKVVAFWQKNINSINFKQLHTKQNGTMV